MIAFLRRVVNFIFWWIVLIACVAFIGYIAWPLLSEKFYSLCSNNSQWRLCHGDWWSVSSADVVQEKIEWKTGAFVQIGKTAVSDVLSDEGGKTPVKYIQNSDTGVYMPQK